MVRCADVPKESGVTEDVDCAMIVQKNVRQGDGAVVIMENFGAPSIGDTPVSLSRCGEGGFQVALVGSVSYVCETFKKIIGIVVYIEGRNEYTHVVLGFFLGADVCMCLADICPVWAHVSKMSKFLAPEVLDLDKFPRIPLAITGVRFDVDHVVVIILHEDNGARGRT